MTSGALPEGSSKDAKAGPRAAALKDLHRCEDIRRASVHMYCSEAAKKAQSAVAPTPGEHRLEREARQADGPAFQPGVCPGS